MLADKTNLPTPYISHLERNPFAYAKPEILQEISQALERPISEFWDEPHTDDDLSKDEQTFLRAYKRFHKDNRSKLVKKLQEIEEEDNRTEDHKTKSPPST